jgi:hypothetical protein
MVKSTASGRAWASAWLVHAALLLGACSARVQPCRSPSVCPEHDECLAQRCVPVGAEPVGPGSQRLVLEPLQIAVVREHDHPQPALPPSVSLGGPSARAEQLLLRFPQAWHELNVTAAFLLLEPASGAEPSAGDVMLDVSLAAGAWSSGTAGEAPSIRSPSSAGVGRTRPPAGVVIDVTALLQELAQNPDRDRGFVVRASGTSERGAVYSTGAGGIAPRLDVYFRPHAGAR